MRIAGGFRGMAFSTRILEKLAPYDLLDGPIYA
jgi:hypothetical protein